jgi:ribose transport system substrate-binding protein
MRGRRNQPFYGAAVLALAGLLAACSSGAAPSATEPAAATAAPATAAPASPTAAASAAASATAAAAAVKPPKNGSQYVIGWSFHNDPKNEFWKLFIESFTATIEGHGGKVISCSGQGDASKQASCMDQFITQDVDAIAIAPADANAAVGPIQKANEAGIPVVIWLIGVAKSSGVQVLFQNGTADFDAFAAASQSILDTLTKKYGSPKGTILEVQGDMRQSLAGVRSAGLHALLDKYPDIKITAKDATWDTGKATSIIQDWLTANPDTDAIILASDANYTPAAKSALEAVGRWLPSSDPKHVILYGVDGSNVAVHAVKCGQMDALWDFSFTKVSPVLADALWNYLTTGYVPKVGDVIPVTDANIDHVDVVDNGDFAGVNLAIPPYPVTAANADNPGLFANAVSAPPNGLSACE